MRETPRARLGGRLLPVALMSFGLLPLLANAVRRLAEAAGAPGSGAGGGGGVSLPVVAHVIGATVFVVLGALQFSASLRSRRPAWHRVAGRLAAVGAVLAAASGVWLAFDALEDDGALLFTFRLVAAAGMGAFIVLGVVAILRRRLRRHRAWMIRAYAIGLGAATQLFTLGFGEELIGTGQVGVALLNAGGWAINLAVAEWVIRRAPRSVARPVADLAGVVR
ncbi:DUF2306 domain-containing protein [Microbacterium sp. Sa1CUA4]|uniref:DUF2306 domain-containing protein n=2 Tax=Microbacterium gallinarum TaxID=2762209 RepID=A0ABR8X0I3_9MICO|nr:DUF2306 domain-containing protein [Microbacterium gallinarum]